MKNFKKVLSLVLAFAMVLSTMTVAFAATNDDKAEVLYKLGLFKGVSTTEFDPALDQETDAAQAIALIGRALQWETDEDATVAFTDVPDWAVPYIAYAVEAKITNGVSDTTFGTEYIDGQRMVAWLLRALGYDMTEAWDETEKLAEEAGLTIPENKLRDDVVGVIYEALTTTPVDGDMTLIEMIIAGDAQLRAVAEAEGLVDAIPEDLEVVDVEGINLIQIAIEYSNTEYDEDEVKDKDNYEFEGEVAGDAGEDVDVVDVDVDGTTVTLTLANAVDNQTEGTLTIDKLVGDTEDDVEIENVEFIDRTFPEIEDVQVVGEDTVKFIFSEPIDFEPDTDSIADSKYEKEFDFDLEGKSYSVDEINVLDNGKEANVSVYGSFKEGTLDIEVGNGLEDFAGFNVPSEDVTLEVVPDEEDPYVTGYKDAEGDSVTLIFNEDIVRKSSDEQDFYHTNDSSSNVVADAEQDSSVKIDGNEMTLTFQSDLPDVAYVYVGSEAVADLWNNENDSTIKVRVETTVDETAPEVTDIDATADEVTLTFSEELDEDIAKDSDNYTILDSDGDEVSVRRAEYDNTGDDPVVKVIPRSPLDDGEYSIVVEDIEDTSGNQMSDYTETFTLDDDSAPYIKNLAGNSADVAYLTEVDTDEYEIYLYFNEELTTSGKYSALDLANYSLNGMTLEKLNDDSDYDVEIDLVDGNKTVVITVEGLTMVDKAGSPEVITGVKNEFDAAGDTLGLYVGRLADDEDNYMSSYSTGVAIELLSSVNISLDTAKAVDRDEITVKFTNDLDSVEVSDFIVSTAATFGAIAANNTITIESMDVIDGDEITLFLGSDLPYDPTSYFVYSSDSIESEDSNGVSLAAQDSTSVIDEIAPAVATDDNVNVNAPYMTTGTTDGVDRVYAVYDDTNDVSYVTIEFTEALNYVTARTFEFANDDFSVITSGGNAFSFTNGANVVTLATDGEVLKGDDIDQVAPIYDAYGNTVDDLALQVEYVVADLTAATVSGVTADNVTNGTNGSAVNVVVEYNELASSYNVDRYEAIIVSDTTGITDYASADGSGNKVGQNNETSGDITVSVLSGTNGDGVSTTLYIYLFAIDANNNVSEAQATAPSVVVTKS